MLEPTLKSIGVYHQARQYTAPFGLRLFVIANKILSPEDSAFITEKTGQAPLCAFGDLAVIRNLEKGRAYSAADLEQNTVAALDAMRETALSLWPRDWGRYVENGRFFHKRAAEGWANAAYGADMMEQFDPAFSYAAAMGAAV